MITINAALKKMYPDAPEGSWEISGQSYEGLAWRYEGVEKPTKDEVESEIQQIQNDWEVSSEYTSRISNYPSIENQLDMLWHSMDNDTFPKSEPFYSTIKNIKDSYSKPE